MDQSRTGAYRVAPFSVPASTGMTLSLDSFLGKVPIVFAFLTDPESDTGSALLDVLNERHKDFGSERSQILAIARITAREARELTEEGDITVPVLADADGSMAAAFGVGRGDRVIIVADRDGEIVQHHVLGDGDDVGDLVGGLLESVHPL